MYILFDHGVVVTCNNSNVAEAPTEQPLIRRATADIMNGLAVLPSDIDLLAADATRKDLGTQIIQGKETKGFSIVNDGGLTDCRQWKRIPFRFEVPTPNPNIRWITEVTSLQTYVPVPPRDASCSDIRRPNLSD